MNIEVRNQEPKEVWNMFADLNAVPRPSKKEERIIAFMVNFGKKLHLDTFVDSVGNVIIKKTATAGFENRKTVILQSHLDMVHQKNNETNFDFETEGIKMRVDGDWVTAKGTTLGADNGLGVAAIMAILASKTIEHPNLEALFTIDEETGMTGAMGLRANILEGSILLNLDTEEDDEIGMGCAGGIDITAQKNYKEEDTPKESVAITITVKGLNGGHSGMDIHRGLGNANKIMNRILYNSAIKFDASIAEVIGGGLRNAIPRESTAIIILHSSLKDSFLSETTLLIKKIKEELIVVEKNLTIELEETELPKKTLNKVTQNEFLKAVYAALNGVFKMSTTIKDLVETSNNIANITAKEGTIKIGCLTRSSSESSKFDLANSIKSAFELAGFEVSLTGNYPGWEPNINSEILAITADLYEKINGKKAKVAACHAGLECGILGKNYPKVDMVSFGPTIRGAHSPDEKASISSTQKFWKFLQEILKNIPEKQ
ncbi:aminoacyl-histidine dipeptidase [Polaribacter tangerinus]|uniref:aminoacyl-histidine dipeptidase n=1 Tax=Polaribacter tangerinus TaxID=1920034 RepID=UPI000B4AFDB6|nr:aminoacyl-histidine dipeptidase [Polaribacter tangerinus]